MNYLVVGEVTTNLDGVGAVFTQIMTWLGSLVTTISNNPLLLLTVGIFIVGGVIGLAKRLIGA